MTSIREVKICLLGDCGVGKSSIVQRFVNDVFNVNVESTIGASFMTKNLIMNDYVFKFQIWDTAGQERYRSLAPMYYRGAGSAIIVYDVTNKTSFNSVKSWVHELRQHGSNDLILAIAGNKCDLEDKREVPENEVAVYAEKINALFAETSARTDLNISSIFEGICKRLCKVMDISSSNSALRLQNKESQKSKCC